MWYLYILRCADNTLYTGITTDLSKRLATHNAGKGAKYVRARLPVKVVYLEEHPDKSTAAKREYEVKKMTKAEKEVLVQSLISCHPAIDAGSVFL